MISVSTVRCDSPVWDLISSDNLISDDGSELNLNNLFSEKDLFTSSVNTNKPYKSPIRSPYVVNGIDKITEAANNGPCNSWQVILEDNASCLIVDTNVLSEINETRGDDEIKVK